MPSGKSRTGLYSVKPFNTQVELVEGCNRMCEFCGIYGIWKNKRDRKLKLMPYKLAVKIAKDFGTWFGDRRIEFAMHGEPLLHPDVVKIVKVFREYNPGAQLQLTTNGMKLIKSPELVWQLFTAGLNLLVVDVYDREFEIMTSLASSGYDTVNYYDDKFNCYHYHGPYLQKIVIMGDLATRNKQRAARKILNHAGNINPAHAIKYGAQILNAPLKKVCTRPFREITVHWDGTVPLCCIDWRHEFIIAKFPEDGSLESIWYGRMFNVMRYYLGNKNRNFTPCYRCDYNGGFRVGLIEKVDLSKQKGLQDEVLTHLTKYRKYAHRNADPLLSYEPGASGVRRFIYA